MENLIKKLNKVEEGLLGMALLGLAIFTFVETVLRYTISYTFTWFGEFANYAMIFCTYLGAAIGVKYGTHFSMEALTEYSSGQGEPSPENHSLLYFGRCLYALHILRYSPYCETAVIWRYESRHAVANVHPLHTYPPLFHYYGLQIFCPFLQALHGISEA